MPSIPPENREGFEDGRRLEEGDKNTAESSGLFTVMTGRKGSTATSKLTFPSAWRLVQPSLRKYRSLTNRLKKGITTCRHTTIRIMPCEKEPLWLVFFPP